MPDASPAPVSTARLAPRLASFLTVSGVAATRDSVLSVSLITATRIEALRSLHDARSGAGGHTRGRPRRTAGQTRKMYIPTTMAPTTIVPHFTKPRNIE